MESYEDFKGKIILAIGYCNNCIINHSGVGDIDFRQFEEFEIFDNLPPEFVKLQVGLYEVEIEYHSWESSYPESNEKNGDSELKILSIKKINYNQNGE